MNASAIVDRIGERDAITDRLAVHENHDVLAHFAAFIEDIAPKAIHVGEDGFKHLAHGSARPLPWRAGDVALDVLCEFDVGHGVFQDGSLPAQYITAESESANRSVIGQSDRLPCAGCVVLSPSATVQFTHAKRICTIARRS